MYSSSVFRLMRAVTLGYVVSAVCVLLLSWALYVMKWQAAGTEIAVYAVYFLSCLSGGFLAGRSFQRRCLLWGLAAGFFYCTVLLVTSWLTGGLDSLQAAVITVGICLAGGAAGSVFSCRAPVR